MSVVLINPFKVSPTEGGTTPSPLLGAALSTTENKLWWMGVSATSYELQRDNVQVYSGTNKTFSDTGLTANTTYVYRVRAVYAESISAWVTLSVKTLSVTPLHAYDFRGIKRDTTNAYGKTGAPNTVLSVGEIYSYQGTSNTLTPTTATLGVIEVQDTTQSRNQGSAYTRLAHNNQYTPVSNINFGTGNFTILFETEKNNIAAGFFDLLTNSADANTFIRINSTSIRYRFITGVGGDYQALFPSTLTSHSKQKIILKRVGTSCYAGIMADDGTVTFGAAITNANLGLAATFNRVFTASSAWFPSILRFYTSELTNLQIAEEFNIIKGATYSFAPTVAPTPKNVTWGALGTNNYYESDDTAASATAGNSWHNVYTYGDISFPRLCTKTSLLPDFIKLFRHSDAKVSNDISIPAPGSTVDSHNIGSIFLRDNTAYHVEADIHYDKGLQTNVVVSRFGKDFDFAEVTVLPKGNGIPSYVASQIQYIQHIKTSNYDHLIGQEHHPGSADARWITTFRSKDNFRSFEKIRIFDCGAVSDAWLYHSVIYSEDDTIRVIGHYIPLVTDGSQYAFSVYGESSDDFENVHNLMYGHDTGGAGAWTKAITANAAAATIAELTTNCIMGLDGTLKTYSVKCTSAYFDPTDGKVYGCLLNGDNNGLIFIHSVNGAWVQVNINLLGLNIVCGYSPSDSVPHGGNTPTIVRTGANSYDLYVQEVVSGTYPNQIWKMRKLQTTDTFATTTDAGVISDDDTKNHDRMSFTTNMHYTGGATAYNGKRLLVASKELTSPDSHSWTKFEDIS